MTEFDTNTPPSDKSKFLPLGFLRFASALSIIGGILAGLSYLIIGLFPFKVINLAIHELKGDELKLILSVVETGRPFLLSSAILYLISAVGAYLMFYLRKVGFHMYTSSQMLLLIAPLVFIKGFPMSFLPVLVTASFILVYSSYLKLMK